MSYQVLARKWRPAKFEQMVGQSHVLLALTNALSQQRLHHAYLFTGTRGVGKTSLARLFAKGLNCETEVTANPCGTCSSCIEIAQGRFVDLIEVDAASRTKVDDTRELLDNVQYKPARGRFKVYLIDEVHMLSRSSFNALLKTLEEPPEHVKFLLATTDPQKLPVTVLSRCLQFNLKSLSQDEISQQLDFVLGQEQLPFESQALALLAKAANGSMRDALSLTDQAIAFGSGQVMLTQVQTMLGSIDERQVIGLLKSLCDADIAHLMQTTAQVLSFGADADEVLRSLLELLHQITLSQFAPAAAQHSLYSEQILAFAKQLKPEQVQLYYQILLTGRKELAFAPDPKSGLEMALLRAVAFVPEKTVNRWVVDHDTKLELPNEKLPVDKSASDTSALASKNVEANLDTQSMSGSSADIKEQVVEQVVTVAPTSAPLVDSAEKSINTELSGDKNSDDGDDEDASMSELEAEQEVLLSQATSMGFDESTNADINADESLAPGNSQVNETDEYADYMHYGFDEQVSGTYVADEGELTTENEFAQGSPDTEVEPATIAPEVDDILDAVLASRDALIADVSAINLANNTEPNAGSIKVGAVKKPLAAPQTNTAVDESNLIEGRIAQGNLQPSSEAQATRELDAATVAEPSDMLAVERPDADRPPWVAASDGSSPFDPLGGSKDVQPQTAIVEASIEPLEHNAAQISAAPETLTEHQISGNGMDLHWYKMMAEVKIGGRIRQLAVNSVCQGLTSPLPLLLKPDQKHLGAEVAVKQLEAALSEYLQQDVSIAVSVGYDEQRETPLELRKRFHQELLQQARQRLMSSDKVQWMLSQLEADLQEDSLVYPPEKLQQVGLQISFQQQDATIMQKFASIA